MDWLNNQLRPVPPLDKPAVAQHLTALGSKQFAAREKAMAALEKCGDQLVPLLHQHLQKSLPLEVKRRVEQLLARLDPLEPSTELLRPPSRCLAGVAASSGRSPIVADAHGRIESGSANPGSSYRYETNQELNLGLARSALDPVAGGRLGKWSRPNF